MMEEFSLVSTAACIESILEEVENGVSLTHSLKHHALTSNKFFKALELNESYLIRYNSAIEASTHALADELLDIPDTYEDVARAKLKSDNIKWLISRRNRKSYGDKLEVDVHHNIDLRSALDSANERVKNAQDVTPKIKDNDSE